MVYTDTHINLDDIRSIEKRNYPFKGFLTPVFVRSTENQALTGMYKIPDGIYEKDFHPSWFRRGMIIAFVTVFTIPFFYLIYYWSRQPIIYSLVLIAIAVLLGFFINDGFINKKKNYSIRLDQQGILIAGEFHKWGDIQQTAILEIGAGRSQNNYLVLVFNDGTYKKFLLQCFLTFWGFRSALSTYIECFKNNKLT